MTVGLCRPVRANTATQRGPNAWELKPMFRAVNMKVTGNMVNSMEKVSYLFPIWVYTSVNLKMVKNHLKSVLE